MTNVRLLLEYDGSKFHGWQKQPNLRTIQGELQQVIETVLGTQIFGLTASGRTDSGVHARGQVCNFKVDKEIDLYRLQHSIGSMLKGELAVVKADIVPDDFNSCRDAKCKQYSYKFLYRQSPAVLDYGQVWHIHRELNLDLLTREARVLEGVKDFKSFQASGCAAKTTIKEIISSQVLIEPPYLKYVVVGSGFLKQMVRNIVGSLIALSDNKLEVHSMQELLDKLDRRYAGPTAPAHGLTLDWVRY